MLSHVVGDRLEMEAGPAVDVAGILGRWIGVGDCLDRDRVPPVVTEVVGVGQLDVSKNLAFGIGA